MLLVSVSISPVTGTVSSTPLALAYLLALFLAAVGVVCVWRAHIAEEDGAARRMRSVAVLLGTGAFIVLAAALISNAIILRFS